MKGVRWRTGPLVGQLPHGIRLPNCQVASGSPSHQRRVSPPCRASRCTIGAVVQQSHSCRAERDPSCALGLEYGQPLFALEPSATRTSRWTRFLTTFPWVRAGIQSRTHTRGIYACELRPLILGRHRATEIAPCVEPRRWRRYDVPQHLVPEASHAMGAAVERPLRAANAAIGQGRRTRSLRGRPTRPLTGDGTQDGRAIGAVMATNPPS